MPVVIATKRYAKPRKTSLELRLKLEATLHVDTSKLTEPSRKLYMKPKKIPNYLPTYFVLFVWLILRWSVVKPTRGCWATAGTIGRSDPLDGCCDPLDGCCDPLDGCCNPLTASAATSVVCCFTPSALPKNRLSPPCTIIVVHYGP